MAQDGIAMLDVAELLQDWFSVFKDAMFVFPLKKPNPDDYRSKFVSVELRFYAIELCRGNHLGNHKRDALFRREGPRFEPQVK